MCANLTSLGFASLETIASENMKTEFVKIVSVKIMDVLLDTLESVDSSWSLVTVSLAVTAGLAIKCPKP